MTVEILQGDCRESIRGLPSDSVHCVVTSPPYFGLRDYGVEGQIGLEQSPEDYVAELVSVFREVHRVLRDDGTVWLNLGDSYYNYRPGRGQALAKQTVSKTKQDLPETCARRGNKLAGLKEKDLIGIPWRVALALQADGWYLRQDIIWHKPNPMPESVKDRCTKAHEYIFLLSKSVRYYFDHEAIKEPATGRDPGNKSHKYVDAYEVSDTEEHRTKAGLKEIGPRETRNRRSVWTVATKPFKGAHFATFPVDLIEPCVLAGCPEGGTVLDPFGGSGTVGIAAHNHKRRAILCELNSDYIKLAVTRLRDAGTIPTERRKISDKLDSMIFGE